MDQELIIFPSLSLTFGGCSWSSRSWSQPSRSWSQPARRCSQPSRSWKKDWKKEDWPKESWKQVWKKEGWKKEGWKKEDWPQEDPEDAEAQEYWGGNAWEKHYLPDAWKKERGTKGKKRKAWIEGQIMRGWRRAIYFLETASPHERGLLVLFNLHAGWRVTE